MSLRQIVGFNVSAEGNFVRVEFIELGKDLSLHPDRARQLAELLKHYADKVDPDGADD